MLGAVTYVRTYTRLHDKSQFLWTNYATEMPKYKPKTDASWTLIPKTDKDENNLIIIFITLRISKFSAVTRNYIITYWEFRQGCCISFRLSFIIILLSRCRAAFRFSNFNLRKTCRKTAGLDFRARCSMRFDSGSVVQQDSGGATQKNYGFMISS